MIARTIFACLALGAGLSPALAQYDANGRYVPSPMGVPRDPYASTVPMYPGKPGGAVGTPTLPRAYELKPSNPPDYTPRMAPPRSGESLPVAVTIEQCDLGWTRETGLTVKRFNALCKALRAH
ncbi:MAG: hypothetical protein AB7S74_09095 [Hyphomicrobium sp.]